jgi:hypothetical protein
VQLRGEWRLVFSGEQPGSAPIAWQYVPLISGRDYQFSAEVDSPAVTWTVFHRDARGWTQAVEALAGTFRSPAPLVRLVLSYRRAQGTANLSGTVTLRNVRLELLP